MINKKKKYKIILPIYFRFSSPASLNRKIYTLLHLTWHDTYAAVFIFFFFSFTFVDYLDFSFKEILIIKKKKRKTEKSMKCLL